jgi:hypothetical protein
MTYFGIKNTRHTIEILPSIRINLPKKNRNDVLIFSWIIWEFVIGFDH